MKQIKLSLLIISFSACLPVLAHDGHIYPDDLEFVVSGIGLIVIMLTGVYVYFSKPQARKKR